MSTSYEILKWDTDFFGYPVARIYGDELSEQYLRECLLDLKQKVRLVYYASSHKIEMTGLLNEFNGLFVDEKTTFYKDGVAGIKGDVHILEYNEEMNLEDLLDLGLASGIYSRYKVDRNIEEAKYEALYKAWVINSVNHKLAEKVFVYTSGNRIAGMITLGIKNNRADIGIVAVKAAERGKGIGKALLKSAEVFSFEKGLSQIQVVTQGNNAPAIALYKAAGYSIEKTEYFYHFWL